MVNLSIKGYQRGIKLKGGDKMKDNKKLIKNLVIAIILFAILFFWI